MLSMRLFLPLFFAVTLFACTDSAPAPNLAPWPDVGPDHEDTREESAITNNQCARDEDCDDGLFCTGFERCEAGRCVPAQDPCQDDVACTQDICQEQEQRCTFLPQDANCEPDQICDAKFGCLDQIPAEPEPDATDEPDILDAEEDLGVDAPDEPDFEDMTEPADVTLDLPEPDLNVDLEPQEDTAPDLSTDAEADFEDTSIEDIEEDVPDMTEDEPPACLQDQDCDDGLFCNGPERCLEAQCVAGEAPLLDDGISCTRDTCHEPTNLILHRPIHALCDNGLFCDGAETCNAQRGCQPGEAPSIDDGISCTQDTCDEDADAAVHIPVNSLCDNDLFCDGIELCDAQRGCIQGQAPVLNDRVSCTRDRCDEDADRVTHVPLDSVCDNDLFCDGVETCDPNQGCVSGPPPVIDDGIGCTRDSCDEDADRVTHVPVNSICDNDLFCDGIETCDPNQGCLAGTAPDTQDSVTCTTGRCDEATDLIVQEPDNALCDNGLFCDGAEICDVQRGCIQGEAPVLNDRVSCTRDRCDEDADRVTHVPLDSVCDNDLFCDGVETCDPGRGCVPGPPPVIDDGIGCTQDSCDEARDLVIHTPQDSLCDSNDSCQDAVCHPTQGCQEEPILACLPSDLCCAPGCHANNDNDCAPQCGNGELEAPEACDVGSICANGARCLDCQCVEACGDGQDNDGDGEVDCEDIDCAGEEQCPMVIPFAALQTQQGGIAAWNTIVSSQDPQLGHPLPRSVNQCGSRYTYRFLGSPDEPGEGVGGPINPASPGAATAKGPAQGIWHLREALQEHGYNLSDLHFGFGRMDLGQDIEGEDWWIEGSVETRRYQGGLLWFSLDGQRILEAPIPELILHVDYRIPSFCGDEEIRARSMPLVAQEWSHRAEPGSVQHEIATAWLQDLTLAGSIHISVETLEPATQFDFYSEGRTGAYYEADTLYLESTPP